MSDVPESGMEIGFSVEHADTLEKGLTSLASSSYDAVLLDLSVPDSFGLATYRPVRRAARKLPIIIFTGDHNAQIVKQAIATGSDNYVLKRKIDGNRLAKSINTAIAHSRTISESSH